MSDEMKVRWGLLRFLYLYTIIGAGVFGLALIVDPDFVQSMLGMPVQDRFVLGVAGSIWTAFGVLSIFGLQRPLRFLPVLLMQLCYKSIWLAVILLPALVAGDCPAYALLFTIIFVSYVVLDLIAIPLPWLFRSEEALSVGQGG